jgi:uncharacterized protein YndB with AHSA1/START domain
MKTDDRSMGEVLRDGDRVGLRFVRRLAHPPAKVWRALTESEDLRHWLPVDIVGERRAGARIELPFWPEVVPEAERHGMAEAMTGEIRVWEPERLLEYTWDVDVLRFELQATDDGTRLTFTTWLAGEQPEGFEGTAAGYHVCLDSLTELLDTGAPPPSLVEVDHAPLVERYRPIVAAAIGG